MCPKNVPIVKNFLETQYNKLGTLYKNLCPKYCGSNPNLTGRRNSLCIMKF